MILALEQRLCPWLAEPLSELESAAERGRLGHAWLITGATGLGKLNLALVFAGRLLRGETGRRAPEPFAPAGILAAMSERSATGDRHPDLHLLYPAEDRSTIAVEDVRTVTDALGLKAFGGGAKVVVVEPAEAMTTAAANALLKSLEEPRPGTYFLLVSHRPGRLLATIRSRCQTLVIRPPAPSALAEWLGEPAGAPGSAFGPRLAPLVVAARLSDDYASKNKILEDSLNAIFEDASDPQTVAEQWTKLDTALALDWLIERLAATVRARLAAQGTNPVTDRGRGLPHNSWHVLPVGTLLERLREAESLRDQLGSGVNAELGLRVLLIGFVPREGAGLGA